VELGGAYFIIKTAGRLPVKGSLPAVFCPNKEKYISPYYFSIFVRETLVFAVRARLQPFALVYIFSITGWRAAPVRTIGASALTNANERYKVLKRRQLRLRQTT
jgi:hypothetical protein